MFCKYCGREIKEGEICTCRQQSSKTPYPKPDIRPVIHQQGKNQKHVQLNQNQHERKSINRSPAGSPNQRTAKKDGKGLAVASFLLSFLLLVSFVLLRVVLQDFMQESTMLESIYPYLIYVVPFLLGLGAFLCAIFSLQDARVRTLSISGILISAIFVAGIFVSKVLFPYEADSYVASSDRSDEEDEEEVGKDNSKDTEDASKEEETAESDSSISQIKSDYQKGTLDYAGVKNALVKLDTDKLESKEAEEVLALQEQTEKDLEDSLEKSAKSSDYESILKQLSKQKEELKMILHKYPNICYFSGHLHNDAALCEKTYAHCFFIDVPAFQHVETGAKQKGCGYEVQLFHDFLSIRTRDYLNHVWMASQHYILALNNHRVYVMDE